MKYNMVHNLILLYPKNFCHSDINLSHAFYARFQIYRQFIAWNFL